MFLCSFAASRAVSAVFFALTVTYILLAIGNSGNSSSIIHAGGWAGIVTAALALYTSCAEVMFASYGRYVLPVFPPAGGRPPLATTDEARTVTPRKP
jgi:succinate-acetate transporter protein